MDFSLVLFVFVVVTGVISLGYRFIERRRMASEAAAASPAAGDAPAMRRPPTLVEYARALFPVVLAVFLLRSFVVEPFRIPSGSMLPSLHIGDFILVNKFSYGIRLPVIHSKVASVGGPARGDVMVFRYPKDPALNFVKRVVGLPGDVIEYQDKELFINGAMVARDAAGEFPFNAYGRKGESYLERIDDATHAIVIDPAVRGRDMRVTVPAESYFVMGDNRDHSNDSRYWRFVPEDHVVGRAFFIWFSWKGWGQGGVHWSRIGSRIQ
ncbi:MAG: signal peptidase I [Gammaproteobacteria bacterium]|nr:signal peptidase I [Gammaproteobacteria bacterium]